MPRRFKDIQGRCGRRAGKQVGVGGLEDSCCVMLSSGQDMTGTLKNAQQLCLPAHDLHGIKPIELARLGEGLPRPHPLRNY